MILYSYSMGLILLFFCFSTRKLFFNCMYVFQHLNNSALRTCCHYPQRPPVLGHLFYRYFLSHATFTGPRLTQLPVCASPPVILSCVTNPCFCLDSAPCRLLYFVICYSWTCVSLHSVYSHYLFYLF